MAVFTRLNNELDCLYECHIVNRIAKSMKVRGTDAAVIAKPAMMVWSFPGFFPLPATPTSSIIRS